MGMTSNYRGRYGPPQRISLKKEVSAHMATFQVDRLQCKRGLVAMLIQGHTLGEMSKFVSDQNEQCAKSSINRYRRDKFIEGHIKKDGSIEVKEKEGSGSK